MDLILLQELWFVLTGFLFIAYSILDGFDLGVGIITLFLKKEYALKKRLIATVAPVWDGNEVWLLAGGGALFAAFPLVYAAVFSGFYLALLLLLFCLIFRAVAIEIVYSRPEEHYGWLRALGAGSLFAAFLLGVAIGNILVGVPLDNEFHFQGAFFTLFRPLPLLCGVLVILIFILQGLFYLLKKGFADFLKNELPALFNITFFSFLFIFLIIYFFRNKNFSEGKLLNIIFLALFILLNNLIIYYLFKKRVFNKLLFLNSISIVLLWILLAVIKYPYLVENTSGRGLTIYNSSTSALALKIMLIMALIGVPVVIVYKIFVYRIFKGK